MTFTEHLRCPNCAKVGRVDFSPDLFDIRQAGCDFCGHKIPVRHGIPDFAEHIPLADSGCNPAQRVMNSRLFALIYETPIWRPLHTWLGSGISVAKEVQEVLQLAESDSVHRVADLACGTGHYSRAFALKLPEAEIYGLDISLSMLSQGRKIAKTRAMDNIMFIRGDIYSLPFDDGSLDQVNCGGALHLFPDLKPIWQEVARVLRPGGVFTAMTLTYGAGLVKRLQERMVRRAKATFFEPNKLAADLREARFPFFTHKRYRVSLIFCARKKRRTL